MPEAEPNDAATKELGIRAAKSGVLYIAGQVAGSLSVLVLLVLLARLLQPSLFGLYAIVIAFYTLLGIIGNFGLGTALRKKLPEAKHKDDRSRLIMSAYALAIIIAVAIALVGMVASGAIAASVYRQPSIATPLMLASILVIFWVFFNVTMSVLVGLERVKEATIIDLTYSILQPIMAVGLVLLGYGVFGAIAGIGISIIVGSALGLLYLSREVNLGAKSDRKTMREILDFSTPIATSNIAAIGPQNFAILLLGVYAASSVVGNYNAAYELGNFVGIIFTSATFVLLPYFAKAFSEKETAREMGKMYNGSIYYTLLFLLPILAYVVGVSQPLMYLLFSRVYSSTPFYFAVIAIGTTLGIFGTFAGIVIVSYGDTRKFMIYQLFVIAVELILLFALTPVLKGIGVLLSIFVIAPIVLDIVYVTALHKQFKFKTEFRKLVPLIAASIITFIVLFGITYLLNQSKIAIIIDLIVAMLLYPPLIVLFNGIGKKELEFLESISGSNRLGFMAKYILDYAQFFMKEKS